MRPNGGLGNQIFCYAVARRLAIHNQAELVIDNVSGFLYDYTYQRKYALDIFPNLEFRRATWFERVMLFSRFSKRILKIIESRKALGNRFYIFQAGVVFNPSIINLKLKKKIVYFEPFGQSERYFSDIKEIISHDLKLDYCDIQWPDYVDREVVCIHTRDFGVSSSNLDQAYYDRAISKISGKLSKPIFLVFGASVHFSRQLLTKYSGRSDIIFMPPDSAENDFKKMTLCNHFIISNSTFAWWAAWIGSHRMGGSTSSTVIASKKIINAETNPTAWGFESLIPDEWESI